MNSLVKSDLFRVTGDITYRSFFYRLIKDPCFKFLFCFRMVNNKSRYSFLGLIYHFFYKHYGVKYGFQIPKSVIIGKGFLMIHEGGIVINANAIIGDNVTVLHGVTIGNTKRGILKGTPVIGDFVYIGPGAVIVGKISIGSYSLIAPNSYVNCDVPPHSLVLGNPCKIIPKKYASDGYINNPYYN